MPRRIKSIAQRLNERVVKLQGNSCWLWQGFVEKSGYPRISIGLRHGRNLRANRVAWQLKYGKIPEGKLVLHSCDNKRCVRPSHLFLGTHQDNMDDMVKKGRSLKMDETFARRFPCKLSVEKAKEIRTLHSTGVQQKTLAEKFSVSRALVCAIVHNKVWQEVPYASSRD